MKLAYLSLEDYHQLKQPSPSILSKAFLGLPELVCYMDEKEKGLVPTPDMNLGTFVHDWIENKGKIPACWEKQMEYYKIANKAKGIAAGDPKTDKNGNPLFSYANKDDENRSLTPAQSITAGKIIAALQQSSIIEELFRHNLEIEPSYFVDMFDHTIRMRPDIIDNTKNEVWEIKTAADWKAKGFSRQAFNLNYDLQGYVELYGLNIEENNRFKAINFLVVGTSSPVAIWVYRIEPTDDQMLVGEYKLVDALKVWDEYEAGNRKDFYEGASFELPLSYDAMDYKMKKEMEK